MNRSHAATRFLNKVLIPVCALALWACIALDAHCQYSADLKDIAAGRAWMPILPGEHLPTPIGDLGKIETVVDLRGFVPMSFISMAAIGGDDSGKVDEAHLKAMMKNEAAAGLLPSDNLRWYMIPTKKALLMLYYGDLTTAHIADDSGNPDQRFRGTRFLAESEVKGETAYWSNIAYKLANNAGPLFQSIAGSGFENAEPTTVFLTDRSAFVLLSFRYSSILRRNGSGDVLVAMEFSRFSKEYRTFYQVYSTTVVSKPSADLFAATAPVVAKVLLAAYTGQ